MKREKWSKVMFLKMQQMCQERKFKMKEKLKLQITQSVFKQIQMQLKQIMSDVKQNLCICNMLGTPCDCNQTSNRRLYKRNRADLCRKYQITLMEQNSKDVINANFVKVIQIRQQYERKRNQLQDIYWLYWDKQDPQKDKEWMDFQIYGQKVTQSIRLAKKKGPPQYVPQKPKGIRNQNKTQRETQAAYEYKNLQGERFIDILKVQQKLDQKFKKEDQQNTKKQRGYWPKLKKSGGFVKQKPIKIINNKDEEKQLKQKKLEQSNKNEMNIEVQQQSHLKNIEKVPKRKRIAKPKKQKNQIKEQDQEQKELVQVQKQQENNQMTVQKQDKLQDNELKQNIDTKKLTKQRKPRKKKQKPIELVKQLQSFKQAQMLSEIEQLKQVSIQNFTDKIVQDKKTLMQDENKQVLRNIKVDQIIVVIDLISESEQDQMKQQPGVNLNDIYS